MAMNMFKRLSLVPAGLRYKLMIVFCLMSIIPLLISVYIVSNYVFPYVGLVGSLSLIIGITAFIAILGFILAKRMIEPIIDMALEAKLIAGGDFERSIEVTEENEIGDLAESLNTMTRTIRDNISELKTYGEKTKEINAEISKKVMVLSGLLQVGNLISSGSDLKTVLDVLVEKVALIDGPNPAIIMLLAKDKDSLSPYSHINIKEETSLQMPHDLESALLAKMRSDAKEIVVDSSHSIKTEVFVRFQNHYNFKSFILVPIFVRNGLKAVLFLGNNDEGFKYRSEDIELLHLFCKQAAIAIENDFLMKKAEELEIKDNLTQLYNNKYIKERLDEEIKRAIVYQRPCSFVLFDIDDFAQFCKEHSRVTGEAALKRVAKLIASELTPVDKAARFDDDVFAIILPERNKKEGEQIANEIRQKIAELSVHKDNSGADKKFTVSGGLSENPIDGVSAKELIDKAQALVKDAKAAGKNMIKV